MSFWTSNEEMSQPPFELSGKSLKSIVIWRCELYAATFDGAGGSRGRDARTTPRMGLSISPAVLYALTLILKVYPRFTRARRVIWR